MICKNKKKIIAIIASFSLIFSTTCTVLLTNNANVEAASFLTNIIMLVIDVTK